MYVNYDLTYPVYFDEPGHVHFVYRKDSLGGNENLSVFKFLIDDKEYLSDARENTLEEVWEDYGIKEIPRGFHTLTWRYRKFQSLPFTEFFGAEIESIVVRGRHSNRLTECYPCWLGHSKAGSGECQLCPANSFFHVDEMEGEHFCAPCPPGYYSPKGSVGEYSCQ